MPKMRRKSPWIHYARFDCVLDLRMDHRQGRLVGGLEMISKLIARLQRINLSYWFANCKCNCKSCYEMRKSIVALQEEEE